jgi:hypothetical protein
MSVGPKLMISAGLACAGLGLVGAGAGATFTAQVSGTMSVTTGTVGLSLNGQTGSNVQLDLDGQNLGSHFTSITEELRLKNIGTLDLVRTYLALTSPECAEPTQSGSGDDLGSQNDQGNNDEQGDDGDQGDEGDDGALAHALHVKVIDVTHQVTEYDGPLCSAALTDRALRHVPAAGETIRYQLVLSPADPIRGLPAAARHSQATLRVTFTGFDF